MKERIRLLADEAAKWAQTMTWSSDTKYGDRPFSDLFNEKFAQLIVEECADLFEVEWGDEKLTGNDVGRVVKKHFGVEL